MKLFEIRVDTEILWEGNIGEEAYELQGHSLGDESFKIEFILQERSKSIASKIGGELGVAANKNGFLTGIAAGIAVNAVNKYYQNKKRNTTQFFAKSTDDKKLYGKIVDDLMKTGHYKLTKKQQIDGGKLWILKRHQP